MITLFDYGVGNLHSLRKAIEAQGRQAQVTTDPDVLAEADIAVLPGVGAFGHVMEALGPAREVLQKRHAEGRPILGVCIGYQVMYEASEEAPGVPGLGLLAGTVKRLPASAGKVPHMGWNTLDGGSHAGDHVYYVHSYAAEPSDATQATTDYGMTFSATARSGNTIGFQFHPEKSSRVGAEILAAALDHLESA